MYLKKCCHHIACDKKHLFNLSFWIVLNSLGMILQYTQLSFPGSSRNKFRIPGFFRTKIEIQGFPGFSGGVQTLICMSKKI